MPKKLLSLLFLFAFAACVDAQTTIQVDDNTVVNPVARRMGLNSDATNYDLDQIRSNYVGPTNPIHYKSMVQVGQYQAGSCYWASENQYFTYSTNQYAGGYYQDQNEKTIVYSGNIISNNAATNNSFTVTVPSGTLTTAILNASLPGAQAGTYRALVVGGGGTGTVTFTVNGSQTITSVTATTATSFSSVPIVIIPSYFWGSGSCTTTPGDVVYIDQWGASGPVATVQADLSSMGWGLTSFSGGTAYGELTDLASDHLGVQALVMDATAGSGALSQLTYRWDTGHVGGVNNTNMNGTWAITGKVKLASGTNNGMPVSFGRAGGVSCLSATETITTSWTDFSYTCTVTGDAQTPVGNVQLSFSTSGSGEIGRAHV